MAGNGIEGEIVDGLPGPVAQDVAALARRASRVNGPVIRLLNGLGGKAEAWMRQLPAPARSALDQGAERMLTTLYHGAGGAARLMPDAGPWGHRIAALAGGAAGGAAGLASAAVELPATVMVMFAAMQRQAAQAGFDPESEEVRLICLDLFGSGAPGTAADDGVNSAFIGARLSMNKMTVQALVARIAPAFSAMIGKTLAAKAVPIIGAVTGAGINYVFTAYYEDLARVRFGLMRLMRDHGEEAVVRAFRQELARTLPE